MEVKPLTFLNLFFLNSISQHTVVVRASCEGSEDPGWGGHVSDRTESPGTLAEEELLQWWPSLLHGDSTKCDWHLQKSNLHPSSRRRAGGYRLPGFWLRLFKLYKLCRHLFFFQNTDCNNNLKNNHCRSYIFDSMEFAW